MIKILLLYLLSCSHAEVPFQKKQIQLGQVKVWAEIARSNKQREQGLMKRKQLPQNEGMLFIFPKEQVLRFWMKNTLIPLSAGFFDKNKILLEVIEMQPMKKTGYKIYKSEKPAQYVLEMNKGWFKKNNIKIGEKLKIIDKP